MKIELNSVVLLPDGNEALTEDIVIDPVVKRVSHLVLCVRHRPGDARLVPIDEISTDPERHRLRCTHSLQGFPQVESTQFVRMSAPIEVEGDWEVGIEQVAALPYYEAEYGEYDTPQWAHEGDHEVGITFHRIPKDRVEIRRASEVLDSEERPVGHVDGFVVDETDHITHLVLEKGHLWGKRAVTIPIGAVAATNNDQVRLSLTKGAIGGLPSAKVSAAWR